MDCPAVREVLPDYALGTLAAEERRWVDRHLAWCAGCRRELSELERGVAVVGLAAPGVDPPPDLEERVVAAMSRGAGRAAGPTRRSSRSVLVAVIAAFLAVGAAGWGAAMAGKAQRLEDAAADARREANRAAREFAGVIRDQDAPIREASLRPIGDGGQAGGRAIVFEADDDASDWVLVVVGGLPEERGPYRARLVGGEGELRVGRLFPSAEGRLAAYRLIGEVSGYDRLVVSDADGRVVLQGLLTE